MYQCENGNDIFDLFIDTFENIVEKHATIQTVKISEVIFKNSDPYLNNRIGILDCPKHFLCNKWKTILTET